MKSRVSDPYRPSPSPAKQTPPTAKAPKQGRQRSRLMQGLQLLAIATTGGAVMLGSLALVAFMRSGSQFMEGVKLALTVQPAQEKVDVPTVVVEQVRNVSELTTAIFTMEAVVPTQSDRKLGSYTIGKTNLLYVAYGEVRASVDLEKITPADVTVAEAGQQIKLVLPAPQLDSQIDVNRSNVYDYNRGWFGPDRAHELQSLAQREALNKIEQAACEQDILQQANDRAELAITQLLKTAGFERVIVEVSENKTACQG